MANSDPEEEALRSAAIRNAASILIARQRAERELVSAKEGLERKTIELAESLARMRATLESTTNAILVTDGEGELTDYNEHFLKMWGISPECMVQRDRKAVRDRIVGQVAEPDYFLRRVNEIYDSVLPETFDVIELIDGRAIERHSRVQLDQGRIIGRVWSFQDITNHRRAAAELREQREWFRVTLSSIGDAVITTDLEAKVTFLNPIAEKMTGWVNDEALGLPLEKVFNIIHEQTREPAENPITKVLRDGVTIALANHTALLSREGRETAIEDSAAPIRDAEGKVTGAVMVFHDVTDRRRAEAAVRESEERLRALANSIPQLAWMAEPDGNIFWYNQKWFEYTGTTVEQMKGWGWQSVHDPAVLPQVIERWHHSITAGIPFEMEFPLRGADGVFRWFLTRVNPVRDSAGRVSRWFGTNTDVDRVKRVEEALREESRVLELLNKTGSAIAAQLDLQSLLQTVTDAATELSAAKFGAFFYNTTDENGDAFLLYTLSGAPREAFEKFGHPRATPLFGPTFRGSAPVRCDDVMKDSRYGTMAPHHGMPAGHLPVRSYLAVPVVSRSGEVFGGIFLGHPEVGVFTARTERIIVGVAAQAAVAVDNARHYAAAQKEIAERGRTEQRLRESEARLRVSLLTAALGTWEYDIEKGTVMLDERCQDLFELPGKPVVSYEEFVAIGHPDDREQRGQALRDVLIGKLERYDIEYRVSTRWIQASAKPLRDAEGTMVRVIGAVLDITDLMKARATVEERRKELENLVEVRTATLQHAIAQMEEFSYSVSHDLRAPLRSIQTYAQVVIEDFGDKIGPEGLEYLQRIVNAGTRMDRLTRDVLTYSKIGREDVPLVTLSLERIVAETIEQYAPAQGRENTITVASPLLPVLGNEPLLVQVISNLLANALKFIEPLTVPRVHFWTEARDTEVRLWIEDNGIGISAEHQARIWGMFERVHPSNRYEGTGIGLAIVRKAAERMGGSVGVESNLKNGSRFWIQLRAG